MASSWSSLTRVLRFRRLTPAAKAAAATVLALLLAPGVRPAWAASEIAADAAPAEAAATAKQPAIGALPSNLEGNYFGEALPGETPMPFAPAVLSAVSPWVEATEFSPDGTQLFLSVGAPDYSSAQLYHAQRIAGVWSPLASAPFVAGFTYANEPVFSPDGGTLTFTGRKTTGSIDQWTVRSTGQGWGTPVALPSPINSEGKDYRGSVMADGTIYLGSDRSGMMQVYKVSEDASHARVAELLRAPVNHLSYEGDPCIARDGQFLVFYSARDGRSADLYVSFRDGKGEWGEPVSLGGAFNTPNDEYGAHLSPDGKLLFFTRHSQQGNTIYWVAASAIEKLKP